MVLILLSTRQLALLFQAAAALSKHPTQIRNGEEAKALQGVGDKISKKIDELLQTGKLKKLENIRNDDTSTALKVNILKRTPGLGLNILLHF
jgi:DNA polymerase beta